MSYILYNSSWNAYIIQYIVYEFICDIIHPFKVYDSVVLVYSESCNHHHNQL